jgi:HAD superfamily hydrolase (TIGR01456 family)
MDQNRKVSIDNNGNVKLKKQNLNLQKKKKQPSFGICFDVDGVLARGTIPLDAAKKAFRKLVDDNKDLKIPTVFVTNALNRNCDKAKQLEGWLETPIVPQQMIQAQGPLEIFTKYHDKFSLVIGQGKVPEIAKELGFKNICFIEDVAEAYPLLDMVDHDNRKRVAASTTPVVDKGMPRIEAIMLLGEPKRWESSLQLIIDLLRTDGKPDQPPEAMPEEHLPVIACNMDLQFMDRACMPRYGHGAYLLCLEALYKKVVGRELKYTALIGKPSEITFRYAEHCLSREAKRLGYDEPLKHMYLIGDTPEVDIVGSNLYQRYVDRLHTRNNDNNNSSDESNKENKLSLIDSDLPESRNIPGGTSLSKQTVDKVISILVCTGVYKPGVMPEPGSDEEEEKQYYHGHRDFPKINELYKPTKIVSNVDEAIDFILQHEKIVVQ